MTIQEFIDMHKDNPLNKSVSIEAAIAGLAYPGTIDLKLIIDKVNNFEMKRIKAIIKKEVRNEIKNSMFSIN